MAKINFPPNPAAEQVFIDPITQQKFVYNGEGWVRTKQGSGIPEPAGIGVQYARIVDVADLPGRWEKVATDIWYLGAFASAPTQDHDEKPVVEGHVYFDTTYEINYTYTGTEWKAFQPTLYIFGLLDFIYIATEGQTTFTGPDNYGQSPVNWVEGETFFTITIDGVTQILNEGGGTAPVGTFTVDWATPGIIFDTGVVVNTEVQIQSFSALPGDDASKYAFVIDEDSMISDSDTKVPTQQSVKAYVDRVEELVFALTTGYKNAIHNGNFIVNERFFSSWNKINVGDYGMDRWLKKSASTIEQRILFDNVSDGNVYTLSWQDTGNTVGYIVNSDGAVLASGTNGAVGITFTMDIGGSSLTDYISVIVPITAFEIQLEEKDYSTSFERRDAAIETTICQRYFYRYFDYGKGWGYSSGGTNRIYREIAFPVTMRRYPTVREPGGPSYVNCYGLTFEATYYGAQMLVTVQQTGQFSCAGGVYTFDAEIE